MLARKEGGDKAGGGFGLLSKNNLKFQEILVGGLCKQYLMGKVTIMKAYITVLMIYNPLNSVNKPEQLSNEYER